MTSSGSPLLTPSLPRMLLDLFRGRERLLWGGLFCVSLASAVFETLGVASILPFMVLVLDPTAIDRYPFVRDAMQVVGVTTTQGALLLIGITTVLVVSFGNFAAAANIFLQQRFQARAETRLATTLFAGYLRQPFVFHVQRDAPSLLKVINTDVYGAVSGVIVPIGLATSRALMAVGVLLLLVMKDPMVAALVASVLITAYSLVFVFVRAKQSRLAVAVNKTNETIARISQEALGGIKELQVLGRLDPAIESFARATAHNSRARSTNQSVAQLPKFALETVAFGGILLVTLAQVASDALTTQALVPLLGLYAFAGYRLLPAFQQVFASAISIRFALPALRALHLDYLRVATAATLPDANISAGVGAPVRLTRELKLDRVSFIYAGASVPALSDVSFSISPRESVGFVGRTGAGKTTAADIILGLYAPSQGEVTVDGVPLTGDSVVRWQRQIGYVPQQVFLSNASIAENIALGVHPDSIRKDAVRRAAALAQADEFISALTLGYETLVGERGVKLSGGQRQRIGIARALYHQPEVLVFDEATSALDGLTEDGVMEAIRSLSGDHTIILIAHRIRTVEACDRVVLFEAGRIADEGTYVQLLRHSERFRAFLGHRPEVPVVQGA